MEEAIFEALQEQLEGNKKRARIHRKGETYLLQGLLVCKHYARAYCGGTSIRRDAKVGSYCYYCCTTTDVARFGGTKLCNSKQVSCDALEWVVWEEVKNLLKNSQRIFDECQPCLTELEKTLVDNAYASVEKLRIKLRKRNFILIDSYAQQYILKEEFEPRVKVMRQPLKIIQEQQHKLIEQKNLTREIELVITNLEKFIGGIALNLDSLNWNGKRDIIMRVVKRIEISGNEINIVHKKNKLPEYKEGSSMQHCCNRTYGSKRGALRWLGASTHAGPQDKFF